MKKIGIILLAATVMFASCKSENGCTPLTPAQEEGQMTAFAVANGITAVKHSSGMYYQVVAAGSGATPTANSVVTVTYTGKRMDGSVFDQATTATNFNGIRLNQLIEGWRVGLPLIQKGGSIRLLVPSSMAYGCAGVPGAINSNAVLYFDIQLVDVQ